MKTENSYLQSILNRKMLICVFSGFSSGLPLYILIQLLPAWLRKEGVSLADIGLFSLIGLPYAWKFLWSPLMDRYTPLAMGRRKSWMLITQILLMLSISTIGFFNPQKQIWMIAYLAAAIAFFSASLDIVLDAYRRELLSDNELGLGNAIHVQAYRVAGLVPGALGLILADHMDWSQVFLIIGLFMLVGIIFSIVITEANQTPKAPQTIKQAVIEPFTEFIQRKGMVDSVRFLLFLILYKLGDNLATALQTPFYIDMGFTLTQIGVVAKFTSLTASIIGGLVGGLVMLRLSINKALWIFGLVQLVSILGFALLSIVGDNLWVLALAIAFEYLGVGLGTSALVAFMARETNPSYAATQLALFTAIVSVPRVLANSTSGFIVESIGWTPFFMLCTFIAIPGMLMLLKVAPWNENHPQANY